MHKRLLALVATVAMVLSMFTGIVFASGLPELALSTTKIISSYPHMEYQLVSGTISGVTGFDSTKTYTVEVGTIYTGADAIEVKNGNFSFYLPTNLLPQDVTVTAKEGTTDFAKNEIAVRYNVATTPVKLEFPFTDEQKPEAITGKVTNSKGEPVKGVAVQLLAGAKDYFNASPITNDKGEFGYVVLKWDAAANLSLKLAKTGGDDAFAAIEHATGKVIAKAATLKVTPNSGVVSKVADVKFKVEGSGFVSGTLTYSLKKGTASYKDDMTFTKSFTFDDEGDLSGEFTWTPPAAGTYTLTVTRGNYSASTNIVVGNPVSYNFINGTKLEELKVGPNTFKFGTDDIHLVQYKADGSVFKTFYFTVEVDGKVAKIDGSDTALFTKQTDATVSVPATKLGTKTIKVLAYTKADDDNEKPIFEKTITAKVSGWDVTIEPTELTVNQTKDVVVVVKDENGNPINNAKLDLDGTEILAGSANVQSGTYTFKNVKFSSTGDKLLKVYKGTQLMAQLKLPVIGQKVYNVTADVDALLQGKGQDVSFTVTRDGVAVMAQRIKWVYEDGTASDYVYPTYLGDGVSKATIKALQAGEITVRAENFDGTLCGETTINVFAPQLVLLDEETVNLTENFKTKVNFKVVDPRDESAITANLALSSDWADIEVFDANGGVIVPDAEGVVNVLGDKEYTLTILATDALYDDAEEEEEVVALVIKVNGAALDAHFEIKEATITSDPGMIVIGAQNNLTLTYEDANGKPIAGKSVVADDGKAKLGKTDDKGQVIYPVGIVATAIDVEAATDVALVPVTLTIKIGYDAEAPKVAFKAEGDKATLVVTDNVRLVRINIDGKEIDFWPGAKYVHNVILKPGVNKFRVKAQDSNDNVLDEVVEIEYKTDAVVLKGEQVKRQGEFVFVQLRQFEEIGAQVGWKQDTQTATFIVGDTKVEVTIGSLTAKVNGKAVTMPAAPFIDKATSRTYVPTRFIAEALNWNVHWAAGDVITITLP